MQKMMGAAAARMNGGVARRTPEQVEPSFAAALQSAKNPAWDPHDVWLNRVKKPRDRRSAS
jgi:hypothetical protein